MAVALTPITQGKGRQKLQNSTCSWKLCPCKSAWCKLSPVSAVNASQHGHA